MSESQLIFSSETFEGLGVGSRLAFIRLPQEYNYIPVLGAILFGITTPLGIAVGLGVRETYNPDSTTARRSMPVQSGPYGDCGCTGCHPAARSRAP